MKSLHNAWEDMELSVIPNESQYKLTVKHKDTEHSENVPINPEFKDLTGFCSLSRYKSGQRVTRTFEVVLFGMEKAIPEGWDSHRTKVLSYSQIVIDNKEITPYTGLVRWGDHTTSLRTVGKPNGCFSFEMPIVYIGTNYPEDYKLKNARGDFVNEGGMNIKVCSNRAKLEEILSRGAGSEFIPFGKLE